MINPSFPPDQGPPPDGFSSGLPISPEFRRHLEELERFRSLLDHASDVILLVRLDNLQVVDANESACRQLNYPREQLIGMPVEMIVDFEGLEWPEGWVDGAEERAISARLRQREGGWLPVDIHLSLEEFGNSLYLVMVGRDITERKRVEEAFEQSRKRFRDLVENINDWVWEVDRDGVYTYASPRVRDLLGYQPEEVIGKTPFDLMPDFERGRVAAIFREALEQGAAFSALENINRHKDGRLVVLETSGVPFFDGKNHLLGYRGVDRDVTARKKAEETLRESDRLKSEFISTAAHELRTPLTTILGFSQILLEEADLTSSERREFLTYIHQQARALTERVGELLDIHRIESGQGLVLKQIPCTAGELVAGLSPFIQGCSGRNRFALAITDETAPLLADKAKMIEVFENLLSNALKYSPPGSPIRIAGEAAGQSYRFSVTDRGIGMTPEQVARVFDKFYRANPEDAAVGGLGLGMSIVRSIVESHGGSVKVESQPGWGTTVTVLLPLGTGNPAGGGVAVEDHPDR